MTYYILLSFHLLAVIIWVSSLLYLYGLSLLQKDQKDKTLIDKALEFYKRVSNPALLVTVVLGVTLLVLNKGLLETGFWIYIKFFLTSLMILLHFAYKIEIDLVKKDLKIFKNRVIISHIYTLVALLGIVIILVTTKPF
jgi:putative membrane protein